MHTLRIAIRKALLVALLAVNVPAWAGQVPQIEENHMRYGNHDVLLSQAIAWQEERDGRWVTVVVLTDRPLARESLGPGKWTYRAAEAAKAQGITFAILSGGIPADDGSLEVWYPDGAETQDVHLTGTGGFEIFSQSATQIKGRTMMNALKKEEDQWLVSFDAPVLFGDAKRMQAEGEPLGPTGGQPAKDMEAALQARRTKDYAALLPYASPDLEKFLNDPVKRSKNLDLLQEMTPPTSRVIGGLRRGDKAQLYWVEIWPDGIDNNRCTDDMALIDGKWRSVASSCKAE